MKIQVDPELYFQLGDIKYEAYFDFNELDNLE